MCNHLPVAERLSVMSPKIINTEKGGN